MESLSAGEMSYDARNEIPEKLKTSFCLYKTLYNSHGD